MGTLANDDEGDRIDAVRSSCSRRPAPEEEREPEDPGGHQQRVKQIDGCAEQRPHGR
jgi:hypothetical protein